ncbi:hypothetical protein L596_011133 [Steinernema carpocapsae]|uniref:Uncharacterized protein n=1 Tax=Steinernema carpocapsae TaxID=34508 RepID=A0A4U5NTU8_STECR|nr:hypothetical protein L596_011133 [Steinernema carpocapsae]
MQREEPPVVDVAERPNTVPRTLSRRHHSAELLFFLAGLRTARSSPTDDSGGHERRIGRERDASGGSGGRQHREQRIFVEELGGERLERTQAEGDSIQQQQRLPGGSGRRFVASLGAFHSNQREDPQNEKAEVVWNRRETGHNRLRKETGFGKVEWMLANAFCKINIYVDWSLEIEQLDANSTSPRVPSENGERTKRRSGRSDSWIHISGFCRQMAEVSPSKSKTEAKEQRTKVDAELDQKLVAYIENTHDVTWHDIGLKANDLHREAISKSGVFEDGDGEFNANMGWVSRFFKRVQDQVRTIPPPVSNPVSSHPFNEPISMVQTTPLEMPTGAVAESILSQSVSKRRKPLRPQRLDRPTLRLSPQQQDCESAATSQDDAVSKNMDLNKTAHEENLNVTG